MPHSGGAKLWKLGPFAKLDIAYSAMLQRQLNTLVNKEIGIYTVLFVAGFCGGAQVLLTSPLGKDPPFLHQILHFSRPKLRTSRTDDMCLLFRLCLVEARPMPPAVPFPKELSSIRRSRCQDGSMSAKKHAHFVIGAVEEKSCRNRLDILNDEASVSFHEVKRRLTGSI